MTELDKDEYYLKRHKKRIRLNELAKFMNCSPSLVCKFENNKSLMSKDKIVRYKQYIDQK